MGELVFLDEYRAQKRQSEFEDWDDWSDMTDEEREYYDSVMDDVHYEYLMASDIATLQPSEVKWIIRQLIKRSDFAGREEDARKMINEILEDREDNPGENQ